MNRRSSCGVILIREALQGSTEDFDSYNLGKEDVVGHAVNYLQYANVSHKQGIPYQCTYLLLGNHNYCHYNDFLALCRLQSNWSEPLKLDTLG